MKITFLLGRRAALRTRPNQQLQRRTPRALRGTPAQRRREHRLALARRDRAGWIDPDEAIATLPRAPRRRARLGRLWAYRIATGRAPGQHPRRPGLYL
jgi:hypothetical protein